MSQLKWDKIKKNWGYRHPSGGFLKTKTVKKLVFVASKSVTKKFFCFGREKIREKLNIDVSV